MTQDADAQYSIARKALQKLFLGDINFIQLGGAFQVNFAGALQLQGLEDCISFLTKETKENRINLFEATDGNAWVIVSQSLSRIGLKVIALQVSEKYLELCYSLQIERNARIHKGGPFYWLAERMQENNDGVGALGCLLLAYIDDVKIYADARTTPAYQRLTGTYGVSPELLEKLTKYAESKKSKFPFYPEEILVGWELENLPAHRPAKRRRK